jgi:hypothetical protein
MSDPQNQDINREREEAKEPDVDLSKRFHVRVGLKTVVSFDKREEADNAVKRWSEEKARVLSEASMFMHEGIPTIVDMGIRAEKPASE